MLSENDLFVMKKNLIQKVTETLMLDLTDGAKLALLTEITINLAYELIEVHQQTTP